MGKDKDTSGPGQSAIEALDLARGAARAHQLRYTDHAILVRMPQRGAQARDVENAVLTSKSATWRPDDRSWKLTGGVDLDGDGLDVAVSITGNEVKIITVF